MSNHHNYVDLLKKALGRSSPLLTERETARLFGFPVLEDFRRFVKAYGAPVAQFQLEGSDELYCDLHEAAAWLEAHRTDQDPSQLPDLNRRRVGRGSERRRTRIAAQAIDRVWERYANQLQGIVKPSVEAYREGHLWIQHVAGEADSLHDLVAREEAELAAQERFPALRLVS